MLKPSFVAVEHIRERLASEDARLFEAELGGTGTAAEADVCVWVADDDKDPEAAMCEAAGAGDLGRLRALQESGVEPADVGGVLVRAAARNGHLQVLQWLDGEGLHPTEGGRWAARAAAEHGHVEVLEWLWEHGLCTQFRRGGGIVRGAAQGGQLEVLRWIQGMGLDVLEGGAWAVRLAAWGGHLQALQFLVEQGFSLDEHAPTILRGAAKGGWLEVLRWVVEQRGPAAVVRSGRHLVLAAAESGNLQVLQWLSGHGVRAKIGGGAAVWVAAKGGHLNVLRWLQDNGLHPKEGGDGAVRAAVKGGFLEMLAYFAASGLDVSSGGSFCGPHTAAERGHLEVLKWLAAEGAELRSMASKLLAGAARGGQLQVLQWLSDLQLPVREHGAHVMAEAAAGGHVAVLRWLLEAGVRPEAGGWEAVQAAARGGHLPVLQWLMDNGVDVKRQFRAAIVGAATGGHVHVLEKLAMDGADLQRCAREAVDAAAAKGHLHVLEWLQAEEVPPTAGGSRAVRRAATGGHLKTLQWLLDSGLASEECWLAAVWAAKEAKQHDVHQWLLDVEARVRGHADASRTAPRRGIGKSFRRTATPRSLASPSSLRACGAHSGAISDANGATVGLHWMMKYALEPKERIFDGITRDASAGSLETLCWVRNLLGPEWTIRLAVESGQLSILQWLVTDGLDIKAHGSLAVRLAAENGHLEMLKWFEALGLELGEVALEAAATGGMAMLLDTLQAFELPLAQEARMAEEIAPFIHTGRINNTLLANCVCTPSSIAEYVLELSVTEVRMMDKKGRLISRAIMASGMTSRTFEKEPDCSELRGSIAPSQRSASQWLLQSGESVPVSISKLIMKAPTAPRVLHALASTERWQVYDNLAAQAIIQAAWHKVSRQYRLDTLLGVLQLLAAVHLTWLYKPTGDGASDVVAAPRASGGGLPFSFWPMVLIWVKELLFEMLQAKAFLYDHRLWRKEYLSMTEAWDWLCLVVVGVLIALVVLGMNDSDTISPVLSFVGFTRWWKVLYSLRGFNYFGRRILPVLGAFREILPFLLVVFFYGGAFVHALFALSDDPLGTVTLQFFRLGVMADLEMQTDTFGIEHLGAQGGTDTAESDWSSLQVFWFLAGTFLVTTSLMNIFIAIMSSAFHKQEQKADATFLRTRASICIGYALCWEALSRHGLAVCAWRGKHAPKAYTFASETEEVWFCHREGQVTAQRPEAEGPPFAVRGRSKDGPDRAHARPLGDLLSI